MKAFTDKSKVIDTIGDRVGGESRPPLFASSSRRRQHLPTPPRHEMRGSIGSSYFGCARNDLRSKDRSRRTVQSSQYEPNGSTRVGEGRSVVRGRVLSQSLLVARERRRREPGYNPVIDTTALTSGEGHVVEDGISRRVRKILAGVPASVVIRDHILALSFSRSKRQYWTVGNRPIRNYDLRSLRRNSAEAQIQDRSRQKTGLNTVPGFSRVYTSFPRTREPQRSIATLARAPFAARKGRSVGVVCVRILSMTENENGPLVSVIMGSRSDLPTMRHAADVLRELGVAHEVRIVSAHRTPELMTEFARSAKDRGVKVIIAGAGGAAHLPGMVAANTILPVIGVPVESSALSGLDSLLSIVQMPRGVPVATVAIGRSGAVNAGLLAAQMIGAFDGDVQARLEERRADATAEVLAGTYVDEDELGD